MATRRRLSRALAVTALSGAVLAPLAGAPGTATAEPRPTTAQVQSRVDELNHLAEQAAERYNDARLERAAVESRLTKVKVALGQQQAKLVSSQRLMGQFAAAAYRAGGIDASLQLLLADDPETFLAQASQLTLVNRRQREALTKVIAARQRLAESKLAVAQELARLEAVRARLEAEKTTVEGNLRQAETLLSSLQAADRARMEAERKAAIAQALAERARAAAAARASRAQTRVALTAPSRARRTPPASHPRKAPRPAPPRRSRGSGGPSTGSGGGGSGSGRAAIAVRTAYAQLGDPYVWGAGGPNAFDCSGLTSYAWRAAGVSLPHSSRAQFSAGRRVSRAELRPGDLVFFYSPISHVGIYVGGGKMVHASRPGRPVSMSSISTMPYSGAVRP